MAAQATIVSEQCSCPDLFLKKVLVPVLVSWWSGQLLSCCFAWSWSPSRILLQRSKTPSSNFEHWSLDSTAIDSSRHAVTLWLNKFAALCYMAQQMLGLNDLASRPNLLAFPHVHCISTFPICSGTQPTISFHQSHALCQWAADYEQRCKRFSIQQQQYDMQYHLIAQAACTTV